MNIVEGLGPKESAPDEMFRMSCEEPWNYEMTVTCGLKNHPAQKVMSETFGIGCPLNSMQGYSRVSIRRWCESRDSAIMFYNDAVLDLNSSDEIIVREASLLYKNESWDMSIVCRSGEML